MKIAVLNCSPKGHNSLTAMTAKYLDKMFPEDEFAFMFCGDGKLTDSIKSIVKGADLVMLTSSIFHCSIHGQMIGLLDELARELPSKTPLTYLTTSNMFYEIGSHAYIESWAKHNRINFIRSLSLYDVSILSPTGKEKLFRWFTYVKEWVNRKDFPKVTSRTRVVILNGTPDEDKKNDAIIKFLTDYYMQFSKVSVEVINLRDYKINNCKACIMCYSDRTCVMKDDFDALFDRVMLGTDIIIQVGTLRYGLLGELLKAYTDRQVEFGRVFLDDEVVKGYVYSTCSDTMPEDAAEAHHHELALDSIAHSVYAGTVCGYDDKLNESLLRHFAADTLNLADCNVYPPDNVYEKALNENFATLSSQLRNMCPLDYAEYKAAGYFKPIEVNQQTQYIRKGSGANPAQMRMLIYTEDYSKWNGRVVLTERRKDKHISFVERKRKPKVQEQESTALAENAPETSRKRFLFFKKRG